VKKLSLLLLLLIVTGCSQNKVTDVKNNQKSNITPVSVLNLKALQTIETITPDLAKHKTVLIGEHHTQYADHLNQLAIIKNLHKVWQKDTSIGLEMIQQPYQSSLNDYIAGKIGEREMLKKVQWYDRWRYDFRLYRPIFLYAKANKIPLVALNIPKELTRKITKVGIKGLSTKERQQLPAFIDRSNANYIKRITSVFGKHTKTSSKGIEKFLDAQLAWDEGMAYAAAKYLKKNASMRMVILAGGGHIIKREGIPDRLDRQIHSRSAVVLNNTKEPPSTKLGDYLLFSPEIKLPPAGLIGIVMNDSKNGVVVKSLSFHGAASKAGLKAGDIIVAIDNQGIKTSSDVRIWALDKKPDMKAKIRFKRQNTLITKTVTLKKSLPLGSHNRQNLGAIHKK